MVQNQSRDRPDIISENLKLIFHEVETRALPDRFTTLLAALKAKEVSEKTTEKQG